MAELITTDPRKLNRMFKRLHGSFVCGQQATQEHTKDVLKTCPDDQFCVGLGTDWKAEFCVFTPENIDKMNQLNRNELHAFASKPKPKRVRIRREQGGAYKIDYYAPPYSKRVPVETLEILSANPYTTVQLLGEIGGASCGPYVTPIVMQDCPQHQFCRTPDGHEMCIYGPWQANETNMKF